MSMFWGWNYKDKRKSNRHIGISFRSAGQLWLHLEREEAMGLVSGLGCVSNGIWLYLLFNYSFLKRAAGGAFVGINSGGD